MHASCEEAYRRKVTHYDIGVEEQTHDGYRQALIQVLTSRSRAESLLPCSHYACDKRVRQQHEKLREEGPPEPLQRCIIGPTATDRRLMQSLVKPDVSACQAAPADGHACASVISSAGPTPAASAASNSSVAGAALPCLQHNTSQRVLSPRGPDKPCAWRRTPEGNMRMTLVS